MRSRLLVFCSFCLVSGGGFAMDQSAKIYSEQLGRVVAAAINAERDRVASVAKQVVVNENGRCRALASFLLWAAGGVVRNTFKGCIAVGTAAVRHPKATLVTCLVGTSLVFALSPRARASVRNRLKNFWENYKTNNPHNIFSKFYEFWQMFCPNEEYRAAKQKEREDIIAQQAKQNDRCALLEATLKEQKEREEAVSNQLAANQEQINLIPRLNALISELNIQIVRQNNQLDALRDFIYQHLLGSPDRLGLVDRVNNIVLRIDQQEKQLSQLNVTVDNRCAKAVHDLDQTNAQALDSVRSALVKDLTELLGKHGFELAS